MAATLARHVHVEEVMGTVVTFDVRGDRPTDSAVAGAMRRLRAIDAEFSTYRPDSAVCRHDRGELALDAVSAELRWVIERCEQLRQETGGYFDAHAGGAFDPSALVKGWAVQRAAGDLAAAGIEQFCINAGGDVIARGRPWRVGIRHPHDARALAAVAEVEDLAVATSGLYERGEHILVPATGRAPEGVLSVTVIGPDLGIADAYATAAFAMGRAGAEWTLGLEGFEAMTIFDDDTVRCTPGFPAVTS